MERKQILEMLTRHCAGVANTKENGLIATKVYIDDLADELVNFNISTPEERGKELFAHGVSDWFAVKESLPNHGEEVLTITEDNWYRITQFGSIGKGKFPSQVTHWMRLPKPPTK